MKYFFVQDDKNKSHVVVAKDQGQAIELASKSIKVATCYELLPTTFDQPGFLVSSK